MGGQKSSDIIYGCSLTISLKSLGATYGTHANDATDNWQCMHVEYVSTVNFRYVLIMELLDEFWCTRFSFVSNM